MRRERVVAEGIGEVAAAVLPVYTPMRVSGDVLHLSGGEPRLPADSHGTAGPNQFAGVGGAGTLPSMRALVQRVTRAAVCVEGREVARIGPGLLVLLGVAHDDEPATAYRLAAKVRALRIFADAGGRMNEPLGAREILCVSQFTLYGDARKGHRPSFTAAAAPAHAEPLYERFCAAAGAQRGVFGAHMAVELVNDGPVTLLLEG
jgi:D-tyrosyl-tRNA(Tyr) deacylase